MFLNSKRVKIKYRAVHQLEKIVQSTYRNIIKIIIPVIPVRYYNCLLKNLGMSKRRL